MPRVDVTVSTAERNAKIVALRHAGAAIQTLAGAFGMSRPQIYHILRRARALEVSQAQRSIEGMKS